MHGHHLEPHWVYIPCDLLMEHLNWSFKTVLRNLGSNVKPTSISRAGKSLKVVHHVCEMFEEETSGISTTEYHPYPDFEKDLEKVLQALEEVKVFVPQTNRYHQHSHISNKYFLKNYHTKT